MSTLNYTENAEARRYFKKKEQCVQGIFSDGKVFDYAIGLFHGAVCLIRIHRKSAFPWYARPGAFVLAPRQAFPLYLRFRKDQVLPGRDRLKFENQAGERRTNSPAVNACGRTHDNQSFSI